MNLSAASLSPAHSLIFVKEKNAALSFYSVLGLAQIAQYIRDRFSQEHPSKLSACFSFPPLFSIL